MLIRRGSSDGVVYLISIVLVIILAGAVFHRNRVYGTLLSLWTDAAKKSPMKSRPHNNLGNCYLLLGRYFEAIEEYKKAISLDRNNIEAYYNIATSYDNVGIYNQAVYYYGIFAGNAQAEYDEQKKISQDRIKALLKDEGGRTK